jgi:hypothetical protein
MARHNVTRVKSRYGPGDPTDMGYLLRPTTQITPERVSWLWPGRIPAAMVTILDGDPGAGKSILTAALAAAVSRGRALPGHVNGGQGENRAPNLAGPGDVIIIALEDDPAIVTVPRLIAARANLARVHVPAFFEMAVERTARFPDDLTRLHNLLDTCHARLVIIDPLLAALNSTREREVQWVLSDLSLIAATTGAAIVLIRHLTKRAGPSAIYRGRGSIGIIGAARSGLLLTAHPYAADQLLLTVSKSNLGARPPALALRIVPAANGSAGVVWGKEELITADLAQGARTRASSVQPERELSAAIAWLRDALGDGPLPAKQVFAEARENGFARRTLERAKVAAEIASRRIQEPEPFWQWSLPEPPPHQERQERQERQGFPVYPLVGDPGSPAPASLGMGQGANPDQNLFYSDPLGYGESSLAQRIARGTRNRAG